MFDGHLNMTLASLLFATSLAFTAGVQAQVQSDEAKPKEGWCEATAKKLFNAPVVRIAGRIKEPRRLKHVAPKYPELPPGTVGSGIWIGDALVGPDGRVHKVAVVRDFRFNPAAPQFSAAIVEAIEQWTYTPTLLDGKAVPVCVTVAVTIHWQ